MAAPPVYDLMLLLDASAEADVRAKIVSDVETAIGRGGTIVAAHDWGRRPLSYEIGHKPDAEYRLIQFQAEPSVLEALEHSLKITDGVVRFRIIKQRPGSRTPSAPPAPAASARREEPAGAPGDTSAEAPAEPAAQAPAETPAETPAA